MASPIARINGGAPGVKASVSAAGAITATLDSIDGVQSTEWFIDSTDETTDPGDYTLVQSGTVGETVTFTALTAGTAGVLRPKINAGIDLSTGQPNPTTTNSRIKFFVPTATGREVGVAGEEYESDATYGSTGLINAAVRGTGGVTFTAVQTAIASATSAVAFNGQDITGVADIHLTGAVTFRNDANTQDIDGLSKDAGDIVRVGENAYALGARISVSTAGFIGFNFGGVEHARLTNLDGLVVNSEFRLTAAPRSGVSGWPLIITAGHTTGGALCGDLSLVAGANPDAESGDIILSSSIGVSGSTGRVCFQETSGGVDIMTLSATASVASLGINRTCHIDTAGAFEVAATGGNIDLACDGTNLRLIVDGDTRIEADGTGLRFFGGSPVAKPTVTGSRGGNAALASLLTALSNLGLVVDSTSA
jgi:hypothetical protein